MVIVGAGQTGGRAALALREQGYAGPVVLIGDEAAPPYERPPLSKGLLTGKSVEADFTFASLEALQRAGIEFRASAAAERIDRERKEVVLEGGERVPYRKLLLATGRSPRRLPLEGPVAEKVLYLRTLEDAHRLREVLAAKGEVVVIGGGFIGLEVAASAVELGLQGHRGRAGAAALEPGRAGAARRHAGGAAPGGGGRDRAGRGRGLDRRG